MRNRPRLVKGLIGAGSAVLVLAACSSTATPPDQRSQDRDVPFTSCDETECTGDIDGAAFEIQMPETWNGTLLLWAHGIRPPEPLPTAPDEPVNTAAEAGPGDAVDQLLAEGFALAGSAYRSNGWSVDEAVEDQTALYQYFVENVGDPDRTIVWGASLGGLITALLAEREADWIDGAAPMCGVVGGGVENLDLALDVAYGIRELLAPDMALTGYADWQAAALEWQKGYDAVIAAGSDLESGVPSIILLAALADAQSQTFTYDGASIESQVRAYGEGVVNALTYGTMFRSDIEARYGGNPSQNTETDYAARISDDERSLIDSIGGEGTTDRLLARLASGERVEADDAVRAALQESSTPVGAIADPMLVVHTRADPLVIAQNETLYTDRIAANPDATGTLIEAFTVAPASYPAEEGAPYGAGHCNFTAGTYLGVAQVMDDWVRDRVLPVPAVLTEAFGTDSGYSSAYQPGPWPGAVD